jgi:hypothetical protein
MRDKFPIDDSVFDRLVDGELSPGERRQLLDSLDNQPDGWRRCALSFLEAQSWRESLGQLVRGDGEDCDSQKSLAPAMDASARKGLKHGMAWVAVAASLLIAFTLGTITRNGGGPIAVNNAGNVGPPIADVVPPPRVNEPGATTSTDALTLFVRDDAGRTRPLRVPLVDAATLEKQLGWQFQSGVPADVRAQLQNRGFDVRSKQSYAPLWLENGRPMFVPVEDTQIVPVGRNVY